MLMMNHTIRVCIIRTQIVLAIVGAVHANFVLLSFAKMKRRRRRRYVYHPLITFNHYGFVERPSNFITFIGLYGRKNYSYHILSLSSLSYLSFRLLFEMNIISIRSTFSRGREKERQVNGS